MRPKQRCALPGPEALPKGSHVLFVGVALAATQASLATANTISCAQVDTPSEAVDVISGRSGERNFDCVVIDMRHREDGGALNVVAVAALLPQSTIVVLCQAEQKETYRALAGVCSVLPAPVFSAAILDAISIERPPQKVTAPVTTSRCVQAGETDVSSVDTTGSESISLEVLDETAVDLEQLAKFSAADAKKLLALQQAEGHDVLSRECAKSKSDGTPAVGATIAALSECGTTRQDIAI